MKITPSILQHEFIGLKAKVVQSSNPCYVGIQGRVLEEKEKVVVKGTAVFHFTLPDGSVIEVNGRALVGRPEDRVKKVVRRRW